MIDKYLVKNHAVILNLETKLKQDSNFKSKIETFYETCKLK